MTTDRYVAIDEEGYFAFDGQRVQDEALGQALLKNLKYDTEGRLQTELNGQPAWVEHFDAPLIARHVRLGDEGHGVVTCNYALEFTFAFASLSVDAFDRFHGLTDTGVPFVLSRHAQVQFFDLLDGFDDDSVTIGGKVYPVPPWLIPYAGIEGDAFWTNIYRTEKPGWDLGKETPILGSILPQLKLSKQRVLVLGAGAGHDAAFFAQAGHMVTAVDFSEEAITRAREQYGHLENLTLVRADAFNLPANWTGRFDLIFEHTCFCAIPPERRGALIKQWRRMLAPNGHLLAVFFVFEKRVGPPYGGSEWEMRERLRSHFDFIYWTRWHQSAERRKGKELVVYARRRE